MALDSPPRFHCKVSLGDFDFSGPPEGGAGASVVAPGGARSVLSLVDVCFILFLRCLFTRFLIK